VADVIPRTNPQDLAQTSPKHRRDLTLAAYFSDEERR
jgi:hypothetical protein